MKKTLLLAALAPSLMAACTARDPQVIAVTAAPEPAHPGQMSVTGTAVLEVSPDCADLTMTLVADGAKPGAATSGVHDKEDKLVAALKAQGVEAKDLKLSYLTLDPVYEPNPEGWAQLKIRTYRAQITITATTKQFDKISGIMEAGADAGVSSMSTQFRRSDLPELKKKVRDQALAAAKDKAKQTADALGIQLGRVVSVNENAGGAMWSNMYFPQVANSAEARDSSGVALGGALQPLTLDVTIGFELANRS